MLHSLELYTSEEALPKTFMTNTSIKLNLHNKYNLEILYDFYVTGDKGFIGSHFVEVPEEGHEVIDIDKMTYASNKASLG